MDTTAQKAKDWTTWFQFEPHMLTPYACDPQTGARSALEWIEAIVPMDLKTEFTERFMREMARRSGKSVSLLAARWPACTKADDQCAALTAVLNHFKQVALSAMEDHCAALKAATKSATM